MTKNINSGEKPIQRNLRLNPQLDNLLVTAAKKADISVNLFVNNLLAREFASVPELQPTLTSYGPDTAMLGSTSTFSMDTWTPTSYNNSIQTINNNYSEIIETLSGKETNAHS